ncbi:hypothetical protein NEIG_02632 [Nematocida sp. ERTm5]|nr:hypothetical protein NEIG_02633 [Nematocida sp. ERTm5]OAG32689.1 hypothetical protein NEIG_00753 [Nematocida sp. ERTm5]OAG33590.1 hypothetical protein NEIG_02008 [Nematocida sp. ERTm5]OAG33708.1 hypothetical protein NEIG_02632 [Nematocida sp. ERTm5]
MEENITRTILITNFPKTVSHSDLLRICKSAGPVREHFVMNSKHSVFFVSFYDLRAAQKAHALLTGEKNNFVVKYTISQREVPKGADSCTEDKNQGTVVYMAAEEFRPVQESDVIDSIKKGKENIIRFYDSREALKFLNMLKAEQPRSSPKMAWDNDLRKRITFLKTAEEIVKNAPGGFFKGIGDEDQPMKRRMGEPAGASADTKKKIKLSTNWMLELFDSFIANNADEIFSSM